MLLDTNISSTLLRAKYNQQYIDVKYCRDKCHEDKYMKWKFDPDIITVHDEDTEWKFDVNVEADYEIFGFSFIPKKEYYTYIYFIKVGSVIQTWNNFNNYMKTTRSTDKLQDVYNKIDGLEPYEVMLSEVDSDYYHPYTYRGRDIHVRCEYIEREDMESLERCITNIDTTTELLSIVKQYLMERLPYEAFLIQHAHVGYANLIVLYLQTFLSNIDEPIQCYKIVYFLSSYMVKHGYWYADYYFGKKNDGIYYIVLDYTTVEFSIDDKYKKYIERYIDRK